MKKRHMKKALKRAEFFAKKRAELKIRKQKLYWVSQQLHALKQTICKEKAKTFEQRLVQAQRLYSFEEYLMYTEPKYVPEGSPTYHRRLAEYNQDIWAQADQILKGAYSARLRAREEYHQLKR